MSIPQNSRLWLGTAVLLLVLSACAGEVAAGSTSRSTRASTVAAHNTNRPVRSERDLLDIDPANFDATSTTIDNRYLPLKPGMRYLYKGSDLIDGKRVPHTVDYIVTDMTKVVDGVRTLVIWDRDYSRGQLEEAELTFFAQDKTGNVWHLGQHSEIYEGKELAGSRGFLVGYVKGAHAGIMMPADPQPNTPSWSEGWAPAPIYWTDRARVYKVGQKTTVPAGSYKNVLVNEEYSASETTGTQLKYYAPGVGNVLVGFRGDDPEGERLELVQIITLDAAGMAKARAQALEVNERAKWYGETPPIDEGAVAAAP
jgi:hypothetical protein